MLDQTILPLDQIDLAPVVAVATGDGAEGIGMFILGDAAKNFINTMRQNGDQQVIGTIAPFTSHQFIDDLGDAAAGLPVTGTTRFSKKTKAGKMYARDVKAHNKKLALNDAGADYWLSTWVSPRRFRRSTRRPSSTRWASSTTLTPAGMTTPIPPTRSAPVALRCLYPVSSNPTVVYYEVKNDKFGEVDGKFVDPVRSMIARSPTARPGR